jgi:exodeoxyribonuclease-3
MDTLRIATWNVNSLRVRLPQLAEWSAATTPDIIALQETKTTDADFPSADLTALVEKTPEFRKEHFRFDASQ